MFPGQSKRKRRLPLAGFLWFLTSVCLLGQSTIQFIGRGFTVDETAGHVVLPVERLNDPVGGLPRQ